MIHKVQLQLGKSRSGSTNVSPSDLLEVLRGKLMPMRRDLEALVEVIEAGCRESLESWS